MTIGGWSSSLKTVAVALYMLSPLVLININGQGFNPACLQFIGGPFVDESTILYELTTIQKEVNGIAAWSTRLKATWAKPSDSYVGSYAVFLEVIPTAVASSLPDCAIQPSDVVVNESMYIKDDLSFGFNFRLTVQTTDEMSTVRNTFSNSAQFFSTNDCYLETMDAEFCSSIPTDTQFVGTVYDLRIDDVYPNITNPKELLATVSWLQPLQLNPEYALNGYRVTYMETDQTSISVSHNDNEGKDFRYSALASALQANESYTVKIIAFVSKDGTTELGQFATITFETPASFDVSTTAIPGGTKEITTVKVNRANRVTERHTTRTPNTKAHPETSSGGGGWMDENRTVVISVIVCASLLVVGSIAFACYIAQVKEEKIEQRKMTSVRKIGNEYL